MVADLVLLLGLLVLAREIDQLKDRLENQHRINTGMLSCVKHLGASIRALAWGTSVDTAPGRAEDARWQPEDPWPEKGQ